MVYILLDDEDDEDDDEEIHEIILYNNIKIKNHQKQKKRKLFVLCCGLTIRHIFNVISSLLACNNLIASLRPLPRKLTSLIANILSPI